MPGTTALVDYIDVAGQVPCLEPGGVDHVLMATQGPARPMAWSDGGKVQRLSAPVRKPNAVADGHIALKLDATRDFGWVGEECGDRAKEAVPAQRKLAANQRQIAVKLSR